MRVKCQCTSHYVGKTTAQENQSPCCPCADQETENGSARTSQKLNKKVEELRVVKRQSMFNVCKAVTTMHQFIIYGCRCSILPQFEVHPFQSWAVATLGQRGPDLFRQTRQRL